MTPSVSSKRERGQSLVEFAISITALLILLAGAVDFGMALFYYISMRDAAQEGAVYGSLNPPNAKTGGVYSTCSNAAVTELCSRMQNSAGPTGIMQRVFSDTNTTILIESQPACEGNPITITITYPYHITMPFISAFIGSNITLRATVTDTILTPVC